MVIWWTYRLRVTIYKKTVNIPVSKPVNISVCEIYVSHGRDISDEAAASVTLMMDAEAYLPDCTALHFKFSFILVYDFHRQKSSSLALKELKLCGQKYFVQKQRTFRVAARDAFA